MDSKAPVSFQDKILLVTGGTGSFGNVVAQRFLDSDIKEIRIFSRDEKKQDDMRRHFKNNRLKFIIGDVRQRDTLESAMDGVDYVYHAAALKQVPTCEFFPIEAVKTNVLGTENVLKEASRAKVKRVVVLSTDKAAYPINAMGMSKALMEKVTLAHSRTACDQGMIVCCTRYGNVMGSRGSVIPLFLEQIEAGSPITITDPNMTRFMMTLDDALDLVLHAFTNSVSGDLFVQKAPAVTIGNLATAMGELFKVNNPIKIIGPRHGEKVNETLLTREELSRATDQDKYYKVSIDGRDLNYNAYLTNGVSAVTSYDDYTSSNTEQLNVENTINLLMKLPLIQEALKKKKLHQGELANSITTEVVPKTEIVELPLPPHELKDLKTSLTKNRAHTHDHKRP